MFTLCCLLAGAQSYATKNVPDELRQQYIQIFIQLCNFMRDVERLMADYFAITNDEKSTLQMIMLVITLLILS